MYYWIDEYELAERYSRKGVEIIDEEATNWSYQTCKQHLGRALIGVGDYDNAYEILESTSKAPVLQSPYYQVRSLWTMGDLFLSIGGQEKGLEFVEKASQLCQEYGLQGQQRIITHLLAKHQKNSRDWV